MIFRQLFEPLSSTYTYLLGCKETGKAILVDPVVNSIERDLEQISRLGLTLAMTLDTHIHADHLSRGRLLTERAGATLHLPETDRVAYPFAPLHDGDVIDAAAVKAADAVRATELIKQLAGGFDYRLGPGDRKSVV